MDINEITIYSKYIPTFDDIMGQISKMLNKKIEDLVCCLETIDDWCFTNEQKITSFKKELLSEKIILVDVFFKDFNERVAHIQFNKEEVYRIDIYFDRNINEIISESLFEEFIKLMNYHFEFMTFGDDYLIKYSQDIKYVINHSSGVKYWIIPKKDKRYDILTIEDF